MELLLYHTKRRQRPLVNKAVAAELPLGNLGLRNIGHPRYVNESHQLQDDVPPIADFNQVDNFCCKKFDDMQAG